MEKIPKMPHIKFKPTRKIDIDFDFSEIDFNSVPEESRNKAKKYLKSNELNDGTILMFFEEAVVFAFDHLHQNEKIVIPEINPVTIFFSNAIMSLRLLIRYKEKLIQNSPRVKTFGGIVDPKDFGNFFQIATNIIVNLQATVESLANRLIPKDREFLDVNGYSFDPSLFHKINIILPEIKGEKFKSKFGKQNNYIRQLIELRNEIIHLSPAGDENSAYKEVYRRMINFKYNETILAVRTFVDFYEQGLIEECSCGREFYYDVSEFES